MNAATSNPEPVTAGEIAEHLAGHPRLHFPYRWSAAEWALVVGVVLDAKRWLESERAQPPHDEEERT